MIVNVVGIGNAPNSGLLLRNLVSITIVRFCNDENGFWIRIVVPQFRFLNSNPEFARNVSWPRNLEASSGWRNFVDVRTIENVPCHSRGLLNVILASILRSQILTEPGLWTLMQNHFPGPCRRISHGHGDKESHASVC